ncbi:MAG: TrmB family transcriptional regulator [Lachnospiraceae bacterium]|nr:TrmB family transcriptional regulator [Lachnospiraceae bacterium]
MAVDTTPDKLQKFGLNLYEAKAYSGLLKTGTANAYKISKESGIPRARIYDVLESITKLGLAMVEETSDNVKMYTPVPSKVFLERIKKEWESDYEEIKNDLQDLEAEEKRQEIYVFTVKGKENITAYCRQLIKEASQYVMVSVWSQMYELLLPELEQCKSRGCNVLGIGHNMDNPMEGIEKHFGGKMHNMPENMHWFVLSADGKKLLYGYSAEIEKDAFYTEDTSHIYLMEDYILHDMVVNHFIEDEEDKSKMVRIMQEIVRKVNR